MNSIAIHDRWHPSSPAYEGKHKEEEENTHWFQNDAACECNHEDDEQPCEECQEKIYFLKK